MKPQLPSGNGNNAKLSKNQRRKLNAKKKRQAQAKAASNAPKQGVQVKTASSPPASVAEFLRNLSNPTYAMMIPRVVPTEAVPHHYQAGMDFNYPDGIKAGAMIITPSLKVPVVESDYVDADETFQNDKMQSMHHVNEKYFDTYIDNDSGLRNEAGDKFISPSKLSVGYHYNESLGISSVTAGGRYYKMQGVNIANNSVGYRITNRGNAATFKTGIWNVTASGTRTGLVESVGVSISGGATTNVYFPAFTQDPTSKGFGFGVSVQSGTTDDVSIDYTLVGDVSLGGGWTWKPREFFENPENGVIADFEAADKFSLTAFSALLSNTSASMHKGGSIRAAQLPGGTRRQLPADPLELYNYLGNYNTRHKLEGQLLADGAFWSYHPEKIQDVMFRSHSTPENEFLYADAELPYFAVAFVWANDEQKPSLALKIKINLEYLTTSQVAPRFMSPADTGRLLEMWLSLGSGVNHVSENPAHLDAVKKMVNAVVKRTWSNPDFRHAAITSAKTLGKLALGAAMV